MKKGILVVVLWLFTAVALGGFFDFDEPDKDAYNKKDTSQYKELASKIVGVWNVVSIKDGQNADERMGKYYKSAKAVIDFDTNTFRLEMILADSVIAENSVKWAEKNRGLNVSDYKFIYTSPWRLVWDNPSSDKNRKPRVYLA